MCANVLGSHTRRPQAEIMPRSEQHERYRYMRVHSSALCPTPVCTTMMHVPVHVPGGVAAKHCSAEIRTARAVRVKFFGAQKRDRPGRGVPRRAVAGPNLMKFWLKFLMKIRNLNNQSETDYFRCRQSSGLIIFASERGALRAPEFQRDARDERSSLRVVPPASQARLGCRAASRPALLSRACMIRARKCDRNRILTRFVDLIIFPFLDNQTDYFRPKK